MGLDTSVYSKVQVQECKKTNSSPKSILMSCMIGNALEWYDFIIYGYFSVILGAVFFPASNPTTQILASWGIFWTGFLARPLGSIIFGHIGDKISRKYALTLSIFLMAIPTTLMGCLPTYAQIGISATILLILLRAIQGFAIGGEYTGTMVFLVEHAPNGKRGLWGSWASFSAVLGVIVGSSLVVCLNLYFSSKEMQTWAWRIPFILSILGTAVGIYIRLHLSDPGVYLALKNRRGIESTPVLELFYHHKANILKIFFLDFLTAVGFFIITIFLATYFRSYLNFTAHAALSVHTASMCIFAISIIFGGWASDRFGRKSILATSCIGLIVFSYPLFELMQTDNHLILLFSQVTLSAIFGLFFGALPATLAEIMPTDIRYSGVSIGHNICMAVVGGGTPFFATYLIHYSSNLLAPAYLLIVASFVSLYSLLYIHDRYRQSLE